MPCRPEGHPQVEQGSAATDDVLACASPSQTCLSRTLGFALVAAQPQLDAAIGTELEPPWPRVEDGRRFLDMIDDPRDIVLQVV
jgi:hypothetical protein